MNKPVSKTKTVPIHVWPSSPAAVNGMITAVTKIGYLNLNWSHKSHQIGQQTMLRKILRLYHYVWAGLSSRSGGDTIKGSSGESSRLHFIINTAPHHNTLNHDMITFHFELCWYRVISH